MELINLNFANISYSTPSKFKSDNIVVQTTNTLVQVACMGVFRAIKIREFVTRDARDFAQSGSS